MINLLGDLWVSGSPNWSGLLKNTSTQLHLYDKGEPRNGRKMGHFNFLHNDLKISEEKAENLFQKLKSDNLK